MRPIPLRIHERGPAPLSGRSCQKFLCAIYRRAIAGEIAAQEAIVRLGFGKRALAEERKAALA